MAFCTCGHYAKQHKTAGWDFHTGACLGRDHVTGEACDCDMLRPVVRGTRHYGMELLRWASGGDSLQVVGSHWINGFVVDAETVRRAVELLRRSAKDYSEPFPDTPKMQKLIRQAERLAVQIEKRIEIETR